MTDNEDFKDEALLESAVVSDSESTLVHAPIPQHSFHNPFLFLPIPKNLHVPSQIPSSTLPLTPATLAPDHKTQAPRVHSPPLPPLLAQFHLCHQL